MAGGGRTAGKYGYSDNSYYSSMYIFAHTQSKQFLVSAQMLNNIISLGMPTVAQWLESCGIHSKDVGFNFNISHVLILQFIYTVESVFICSRLSYLSFPNDFRLH